MLYDYPCPVMWEMLEMNTTIYIAKLPCMNKTVDHCQTIFFYDNPKLYFALDIKVAYQELEYKVLRHPLFCFDNKEFLKKLAQQISLIPDQVEQYQRNRLSYCYS